MANTDAPFGFRQISHAGGGTPARSGGYTIASGFTSNIFSGDFVRSVVGQERRIERALADTTTRILGIFAGVNYVDPVFGPVWSPFWPANTVPVAGTKIEAYVFDDPNLELAAQISTVSAADFGALYDITVGTGNTTTGQANGFINQADTTNPKVRVEGLFEGIGGIFPSELGAFAKVRCKIVNHEKARGTLAAVA